MSSYTITITSEGDGAQTTLRVDDSGTVARIVEFSVKATEGRSLSTGALPGIDLDLLLRSLRPASEGGKPGSAMEATAATAATYRTDGSQATRGVRGNAKRPATGEPVDTGQSTGSETERQRRPASTVSGARAYRRMPDDLAATYAAVGSVTALAAHYGVPRHAAQGWIGRMRRQARDTLNPSAAGD